ncbi:MAG: MFS transporter, partial [Cyclobacteriaceae bacterium]
FQDWFGSNAGDAGLCSTGTEVVSSIPTWVYYSFFLGAIASITTILWSVMKTPEIPPSDEELKLMREKKKNSTFMDRVAEPFIEIYQAIGHMPKLLRNLSLVYFFQWYALFVYWQFVTPMLRKSMFGISNDDLSKFEAIKESCKQGAEISATDMSFAQNVQNLSEQALGQTGLMNGTYNLVTMVVALALVPFASRFGNKLVYVASLVFTGIAMLSMPYITNQYLLLIPMTLFGIGWAAMMGIPYSMVSKVIPQERRGVYMGIVNMMIVIPMLIQTVSFGPIIKYLLFDNAVYAILFGGVFFILAALFAMRLDTSEKAGLE